MRINGNLTFPSGVVDGAGTQIENFYIEKFTSAGVPDASGNRGRMIFVTTTGGLYNSDTFYYSNGTTWVALATGGNAAALQTEVDNIEVTLGSAIAGNGTHVPGSWDSNFTTILGGTPTSFTDAINKLAAYAVGNNTLAELDDVTLSTPTSGQFLRYNGSVWVNHTLVWANISDVTLSLSSLNGLTGLTATASDLNKLTNTTASAADFNSITGYAAKNVSDTEFGYLDGVTSPIQTQLDNKQPLDATLTALAGMAAPDGIVVQTATDTFAKRTLQAPAAGITIQNPAGIAGDPTFALANDLAALEGLTGTGYIVRTGDGTATTRSITGIAGQIDVTNGSGVSSNTDIGLATVTQGAGGSFLKVTLDAYGRVTQNTAVTTSDITALVDATYVNATGDTMSGNLVMSGGSTVTGLPTPANASDAANKAYVDAVAEGLHVHAPTQYVAATTDANWATVAAATYNNGTAGVGATLTMTSLAQLDGQNLVNGQRIMVIGFSGADLYKNGIYVRTSPTVWTRASDFDTTTEVAGGDFVFNQFGDTYAASGFVQTKTTTAIGTSPAGDIQFQQFSGQQAYVWGTGLSSTGNQVYVNLGAGIFELPNDEIGIELFSPTSGGLILTDNGTTRATTSTARLHLLTGAGLTQDATGLYIANDAITNAMILNDTHPLNADAGGPGSVALGGTISILGTSTQGINTSVSGSSFTITAADAAYSQKGVASFDTNDFTVTAGAVSIKLGGVDNNQLANSTIGFTGTDASSDTVALGETLTFADGGHAAQLPLTKVAIATNTATITLRQATNGDLGVASFDSDHFSVTAGAVSLAATLDDLTNVSNADTAGTGDLLTKTAGDWQPVSRATLFGGQSIDSLSDVTISSPVDNDALIWNGSAWVNQKIYHLYTGASSTTHTVSHGLNQKYCNVTVIDSATDEVIIPQAIVFNSASQLTVTLTSALAVNVVVMGIA